MKRIRLSQKNRPIGVTVAAGLQLLIAATFVICGVVAFGWGGDANAAARAEVARQGFPVGVLANNHINFGEGVMELVLPVAIALGITVLALLNLAGNRVGRILTWVLQPMLFVAGGFIISHQIFATHFIEQSFSSSGNPTLQHIDVSAFVDAAVNAYPPGFLYVDYSRFGLVVLGSLVIIVLLAIPAANAYFRKAAQRR